MPRGWRSREGRNSGSHSINPVLQGRLNFHFSKTTTTSDNSHDFLHLHVIYVKYEKRYRIWNPWDVHTCIVPLLAYVSFHRRSWTMSACQKYRHISNSRPSRPVSSAATSKLPVNVVNGKSKRVSVFGQGTPNSIVIAKWLRTIIGRRQKWPIRTSWPSPLPPHRAAFFLQTQQSSDLQEGYYIAFPSSMFGHHELRKSDTAGRNGKHTLML